MFANMRKLPILDWPDKQAQILNASDEQQVSMFAARPRGSPILATWSLTLRHPILCVATANWATNGPWEVNTGELMPSNLQRTSPLIKEQCED